MEKYQNRHAAGKLLATALKEFAHRDDVLVLALPRGGVPVGYEVARALDAPLDVLIVRKLGVPGHAELAMGAIAMGGQAPYINDAIVRDLQITHEELEKTIEWETRELKRRESAYRQEAPFPSIKGKTVIIVDDGIATGATMQAAIKTLSLLKPHHIIVAVPVADKDVCTDMRKLVHKLICPLQPEQFYAVGTWYEDFSQTSDDEVFSLLNKTRKPA